MVIIENRSQVFEHLMINSGKGLSSFENMFLGFNNSFENFLTHHYRGKLTDQFVMVEISTVL